MPVMMHAAYALKHFLKAILLQYVLVFTLQASNCMLLVMLPFYMQVTVCKHEFHLQCILEWYGFYTVWISICFLSDVYHLLCEKFNSITFFFIIFWGEGWEGGIKLRILRFKGLSLPPLTTAPRFIGITYLSQEYLFWYCSALLSFVLWSATITCLKVMAWCMHFMTLRKTRAHNMFFLSLDVERVLLHCCEC